MDLDLSVWIHGDADDVFTVLDEVQRYATGRGSPVRSMTKTPAGPTDVGTQWHEVVRVGRFLHLTMHSRVTDRVPGRSLAMDFHGGGMSGSLRYTIVEQGDGIVRLRQEERLVLRGPLRLGQWVVRRMLEPRLQGRLAEIRALVEAGHVPRSPS